MYRAGALAREAVVSALAAASVAALLAWYGPPGSDFAAHAYQRAVFLQHGFSLWNNFWYAGRYSFVTYSLLYYPLAGLLGIRLLAVATIATAALAFAIVIGREWGPTARWSSRTFAVVWAGVVLSAAFPFALGIALALLALWALQARRLWRFALLCALTLAASPLAFLLFALLLGGIAVSKRVATKQLVQPGLAVAAIGAIEVVLWRLFPGGGRYPFSFAELAAAVTFCLIGAGVTWRVERARILRAIFVVYLAACLAAYLVPSAIGENIARLRFAAIPVAVLALSLREWRPRLVAVVALGLAIAWNVTPLAASYAKGSADPASAAAYWAPAVRFLEQNLTPSYRVEVVDTTGHWGAVYLPKAGIPLARGWFRQDDFPENQLLYSALGPRAYTRWLRSLGVRYVVLTSAPVDYSARGEDAVVRSGQTPLRPVFTTSKLTVFELDGARPIVTGPGKARVLRLTQSHAVLQLGRPGTYRVAIRYSPYWKASTGCVSNGSDGMMRLVAPRAGAVTLGFDVDAQRALTALAGQKPDCP
ncbi:MAG TPA: hypothetical protein VMT59_05770 [Gaiellaceae bacterium]|nr:hypothetical protein [Gaiellaceae bacterium]